MFIVLEGIDGAGISTQARLLVVYLESKGKNVLLTKEPTNNEIGKLIRSALRKEWNASLEALQLLFVADRAQHLFSEILPALKEGKIVVCDRYFFSTIAYGMLELKKEWLKQLNERFLKPDITFILDVPASVSLERIKRAREQIELFEEEKKLTKVRNHFLELAKEYENCFVIDGTKTIEEVHEEIKKIVNEKLKISNNNQ